MKTNQLTKGKDRRLLYIENKDGEIDGVAARIGWARFSKSGRTIYYRGRELMAMSGGGIRGNYIDTETREEYWVSGIKKSGSNVHPKERVQVEIDSDACEEYGRIRNDV